MNKVNFLLLLFGTVLGYLGSSYIKSVDTINLKKLETLYLSESNILEDHPREYSLPLNNPVVVPALAASYLNPEDLVVGVFFNSQYRAYPWWVMSNFHISNDTIGGKALLVTFCEACSAAAAFEPQVERLPKIELTFRACGLTAGTYAMCDQETHSRWHPFLGTAFEGPLKGSSLKRVSVVHEYWGVWKTQQPQTEVILADTSLKKRRHGSFMLGIPVQNESVMKWFASNYDTRNKLLKPYELIYGLHEKDGKAAVAYPLTQLRNSGQLLQDSIGSDSYVIFNLNDFRIYAYLNKWKDQKLDLKQITNQNEFIMEDQFGSRWNQWGLAVSGKAKGDALLPANGHITKWYDWISNYPDTRVAEIPAGTSSVISLERAKNLLGEAVFVDMNPEKIFRKNHIPGAINLAFTKTLKTYLPSNKDKTIIFYCKNELCNTSAMAAQKAKDLGYKQAFSLSMGLDGWQQAGFKTISF